MPTALERLEDGLFQGSRTMGPPWGPLLRLMRYPVAIARDWLQGEIAVRAMSLAYTTLLSLVPLLVFSFAILKGIGARADLHFILHQFFRPLGLASNQLTESLLEFVGNMRGDVLGSLGLIFLTYTVITTIQKVETSFNFVWRVQHARNFARRFTEYLSVMIAGPILLAVALGLLGSALHSPTARWLDSIAPLAWVLTGIAGVLPYVIVSAVFVFMYMFIPNIRVEARAALIGGVTAGVVWALVGKIFTSILVSSSTLVAVYSGFAIVLSTLIWVYLSWLILLLGATLAFYVQFPQYLPHGHTALALDANAREGIGVSVMFLVARDYQGGAVDWNAARLADTLDLPGAALAPVLAGLQQAQLLVATEKDYLVPGRDPHSIKLHDIIDALRRPQHGRALLAGHAIPQARELIARIDATVHQDLGERSLAEFIDGTR
jgi:membrane protein